MQLLHRGVTQTAMSRTLVLQGKQSASPFVAGARSQALNLNHGHDSVVTTQMANVTVRGNGSAAYRAAYIPPLDTHVTCPSCPLYAALNTPKIPFKGNP